MSEDLSLFQQCSSGLDTTNDLATIVECIADRQALVSGDESGGIVGGCVVGVPTVERFSNVVISPASHSSLPVART